MRFKQSFLALSLCFGYFVFFGPDLPASFVKQSVVTNVRVFNITRTSATISWLSSVGADSQVEYGTTAAYGSLTALDPAQVKSHSQNLSGLIPNTLYHFSVMSRLANGTLYTAGDLAFTTPSNIVAGMIGGLSVSAISGTTATISWTTPTPANSAVQFGTSTSSGPFNRFLPALVTSHTVVLAGLQPLTFYLFRVESADANGNMGISGDSTFTTTSAEAGSIFSAISVSGLSSTSATISWLTSHAAGSQVDYGTGPAYGNSTALDPFLMITHSQTLVGLTPNTLYHYRVRATGGGEGTAISGDYTFTTSSVTLFYPQVNVTGDTYTGIAITNLDQGPAQLNFTGFNVTGSEIATGSSLNSLNRTLGAGSQLVAIQDQLFGSSMTASWPLGWTMVDSSTQKVAGLFLIFNSSLSFLDGAETLSTLLSSFVLPETGSYDFTTIFLGNPNSADASVTMDLVKADGTVRSSSQVSIPAFGTYSADLSTAAFAGISTDPSDYLRVSSSQGLLPYEYFGNQSKDFSVLAGQDTGGGSAALYSPQYVVGGGYTSTLSIVNLDSVPGTVTLALIGDNGSRIGAAQALPIPAGGKIFVSDQAFFQVAGTNSQIQGYVKVTSDGVRISGNIAYGASGQGTFSTALPLVSTLRQSLVLSQVASNRTYFTGLAILNPNDTAARVQIDRYDSGGSLVETTTQILAAGQRISRLMTEYFPSLVGQDVHSGYIKLTADKGIASFGVFGTQSLSVLSAIPAQVVP
jgi:hypothetical protein